MLLKRLFLLLLFASPCLAQTPTVAAHAAAVTSTTKSSVTLSVNASDLIFVVCVPDPTSAQLTVTDSAGDTFAPFTVSVSHDTATVRTFWTRSAGIVASLTVTCTAPNAITYNQIYATVVSGGGSPAASSASGDSSPAVAKIASAAGDLVLAMVESGSASNATGWTSLLSLDSNLLASLTAAGSVSASFPVSRSWNIVLIDIPPAVFTWQLLGGPKIAFPMQAPPSCGPNDGACSIQIQACDTSQSPPVCLTTSQGTVSLVKTVTLPVPQAIVTPVAVTNP